MPAYPMMVIPRMPSRPPPESSDDLVLSLPRFQSVASQARSTRRREFIVDGHFTLGHRQLAESLAMELWEDNIRSPMPTAVLGELMRLRDRAPEAEPLLRRIVDQQQGNPRPVSHLAECLHCGRLQRYRYQAPCPSRSAGLTEAGAGDHTGRPAGLSFQGRSTRQQEFRAPGTEPELGTAGLRHCVERKDAAEEGVADRPTCTLGHESTRR